MFIKSDGTRYLLNCFERNGYRWIDLYERSDQHYLFPLIKNPFHINSILNKQFPNNSIFDIELVKIKLNENEYYIEIQIFDVIVLNGNMKSNLSFKERYQSLKEWMGIYSIHSIYLKSYRNRRTI